MKYVFLSHINEWYGKHSGYYLYLPLLVKKYVSDCRLILFCSTPLKLHLHKLIRIFLGVTLEDIQFIYQVHRSGSDQLNIILDIEERLEIKELWNGMKLPRNVIATIHYPASTWNKRSLHLLSRYSSAIMLYQKDIPFFEKYIGRDRIAFVRHGVDVDFFIPAKMEERRREVVIVGQFHRDWKVVQQVLMNRLETDSETIFNFIIPLRKLIRKMPWVREHKQIKVHSRITDQQLLSIYQRSRLMFLPLVHSGANNAVVEAMSCGLPIVTTDVGGIRDYGGGSIYELAAPGCVDSHQALLDRYLDGTDLCSRISKDIRDFSVRYLDWKVVVPEHLKAYRELAK
ncbi:MAG: glycosyltransferase family 4 protein [Verrucomicrobiota bacterium]